MSKKVKGSKKADGIDPTLRKQKILQDLENGLSKSEAARQNNVSPAYVTRLLQKQPEAVPAIKASVANILDDRQRRWDEFIEQESEDLLTLVRDSTQLLKTKLKELQANPDGMTLKKKETTVVKPPDKDHPNGSEEKIVMEQNVSMERALRLFKEMHSLFASLQKGAQDVPPPENA